MNHESESRESAPALEKSAEIVRQYDPLSRDAVNRATGFEHIGSVERLDARMVAIVGVFAEIDRPIAGLEHANLITQREIDRRRTELIALERVDLQSAGFEFRQDRFAGQDGHRARDGTLPAVPHPYFDLPRPLSIAHRGCAGEAPENTFPAFDRALAQRANVLESDLQLSRDGVPVLIHDAVIDRVTNGSGAVADLSAAELLNLDAGFRFRRDGDQTHPYRGLGVKIPSLEEAFRSFPGIRFNLEIKAAGSQLIDATLDLIAEHRREAITLLTAGDDEIMAELRERLGKRALPIAQGASERDIRAFLRGASEGTEPPAGPMALQVPPSIGDMPLVSQALIEFAHARGVQVHVWTINDPGQMHRLLDLGADGIITDYPGRLAAVLADRRGGR